MKHPQYPSEQDLLAAFPRDQYPKMWPNQKDVFAIIGKQQGPMTLQLPTGEGKTVIGYTILKALEKKGLGPLFYIASTKTIVEQVKKFHPEVKIVFGRNEYPCPYYQGKVTAEDAPCSMLDCPHRINQETGQTQEVGASSCPYQLAKYQAKQGGIIVCTSAFYLFTQLFTNEWNRPAGLIIDEAHQMAKIVRNCLSFEITDYHLKRAIELLSDIDANAAKTLDSFFKKMIRIARQKPTLTPTILEAYEIKELMDNLVKVNSNELGKNIKKAVKEKVVDTLEQREVLKRLEIVVRDVSKYLRSLGFSIPTEHRQPLNYTYAFYKKALDKNEKVQYQLSIRAYYVAPIIQKILSPYTIAYSATIGDPDVFGFETGIKFPFYQLPSHFPVENTRIFLPKDCPNLALKTRSRRDLTRILRRVAKACKGLADKNIRSLVVVISEKEREKFLALCKEEGVEAVSYGNGKAAKDAVQEFKDGKGKVLVGTVANFGEGIDLPRKLAQVIFFLRPGYPRPSDPATIFEERRFGSMRWKLWNWRVMIEALQIRGRNIRSAEDLGVTFFISQQFRRFIPAVLPEWLWKAYKGDMSFEECVKGTIKLLEKK